MRPQDYTPVEKYFPKASEQQNRLLTLWDFLSSYSLPLFYPPQNKTLRAIIAQEKFFVYIHFKQKYIFFRIKTVKNINIANNFIFIFKFLLKFF